MTGPRVALLGFSIECNRFAPLALESDFRARTLLGEISTDRAKSVMPFSQTWVCRNVNRLHPDASVSTRTSGSVAERRRSDHRAWLLLLGAAAACDGEKTFAFCVGRIGMLPLPR